MKKTKDPWAHLTDEQKAFIHERALDQLRTDCAADMDYLHDTLSQYICEGGIGRALECISDDKAQIIVRLDFDPSTGKPVGGGNFVPNSLGPVEMATLYYFTELALMEFPYKAAKPSKKKKKGPVEPAPWEARLMQLVNAEPKMRPYEQIPGDVVDAVVNQVAEHIELRAKHLKKVAKQQAKDQAKLPPAAPPS